MSPPSHDPAHRQLSSPPTAAASVAGNRKVNRSCIECTRRKIKCDGRQPCGSCVYYRASDACEFRQRSRRNAVSRSSYDKLTEQLHQQSRLLDTLFPGTNPAQLMTKTRHELVDLVNSGGGITSHSHPHPHPYPHSHHPSIHEPSTTSPPAPSSSYPPQDDDQEDDSAPGSEDSENPDEGRWDESLDKPDTVATDDINAIGLATNKQARSYLGISSMSAVFRAIFRLYPATKEFTAQRAQECAAAAPVAPSLSVPALSRDPAMAMLREQRCVDFFFDHFHAVTPLVDEVDFRNRYAAGDRSDGSWMALLNMVLCLGSIASGSETLHEDYYRQARSFFSLDSLGSGNMYNLQALCLLGGQYLHYRNSPNMAYSILGAAHRVAIALGLHREPRRHHSTDADELRRIETRRRTWWSLVCLDSWACMTQGRPTCGRWDSLTMDTALPSSLSQEDHVAMSLNANSRFCLICEKIQHRMAKLGRLSKQDISVLDDELVSWFDALPSLLRQVDTSAHPRLQVARDFLRTRYFNARVILARCMILLLAQDWKKKADAGIIPQHRQSIEKCCVVAAEAIDAIVLYWTPTRFQVWNSAWYLFQACTVPLLAMAMERNTHTTSASKDFTSWRDSLAKALAAFAEMRPWMRASDRSPDIVSAMFEALTSEADAVTRTPSATDGSLDLFGWCDEQLTEMDWSMFLGESMPPDMLPNL